MDQSEFQDLLKGLCSGDSSSVLKAATSLHKLTVTKEIQDFDWTSSLYDSIWRALHDCWLKASSTLTKVDVLQIWRIEKLLVDTFSIIIGFPEFELGTAAESQFIRIEMLQALFKRVLIASQSLLSVQHCLHWIYQNRLDLRSAIRIMLCSTLLAETTLDASMKKGRYKDGGRGRDHVGPMLEVLLCIVEGFTFCPRDSCKALLMNVLMPLHQPNEMVEWRDQIPVLQLYHRQLLRCVQAVIEKSRAPHNTVAPSTSPGCTLVSNQQQESLLVTAVRGLLSFWPPSHSANTPKEILMMHELEGLVLMATVTRSSSSSSISSVRTGESEFLAVLPLFLKKVASALGKVGDSDNFRTSQRALQTFKSKALLLLLAEQHCLDKEIEEKRELEDGGNTTVASPALSSVFSALIPALYRGGQLSWNPTVNKMTALALRNLKALDEDLFRKCCDSCLSTPLDGASCSISDSNTDSAVRTGEAQGHSLDAEKGVSAADAAGGDISVADYCVGHASRLSLHSDPEGQHGHGHGPPSQTHLNKKMRPPLPVQDAIFAPASALGSKAIPPCFQAQMCPQSLSSMMQQSTAGKVEGFHALKA
jgi:Protein phosphatase 2A regulatory B subunit (B56 family)